MGLGVKAVVVVVVAEEAEVGLGAVVAVDALADDERAAAGALAVEQEHAVAGRVLGFEEGRL